MANTVEDIINDIVCEKVEEEINNADIETIVEDKVGEYLDDNIVELLKNNLDDVVKLLKDKL
jgi:transcription initiation factor IIE alpha subunit